MLERVEPSVVAAAGVLLGALLGGMLTLVAMERQTNAELEWRAKDHQRQVFHAFVVALDVHLADLRAVHEQLADDSGPSAAPVFEQATDSGRALREAVAAARLATPAEDRVETLFRQAPDLPARVSALLATFEDNQVSGEDLEELGAIIEEMNNYYADHAVATLHHLLYD